MYSKSLNQY
nr:unnamed protein product [Callosobruchus analis]CAI5857637.1 unnamed protein product [Callosobruchus analis]